MSQTLDLLPCPLCHMYLRPAADPRMTGMLEHPPTLHCPISALCFMDTAAQRASWNRRDALPPPEDAGELVARLQRGLEWCTADLEALRAKPEATIKDQPKLMNDLEALIPALAEAAAALSRQLPAPTGEVEPKGWYVVASDKVGYLFGDKEAAEKHGTPVPLYAAPVVAAADLREAAADILKAYEECSGAEPSLSALYIAIDVGLRAALHAAPQSPMGEGTVGVTTYRHKKRGTIYELVGYGEMQSETWLQPTVDGLRNTRVDMAKVAVYRSLKDGSLWVRPVEEFEDGRFEKVAAPE